MSEQFDSLGEKTKQIEISLKYTNGDMEKAKAMASGQYLDSMAVKVKFYQQNIGKSGMLFAFFNTVNDYISYVDVVVVSNSSIYDKVRIFDDWRVLYADLAAYQQGGDSEEIPGIVDRIIDEMVKLDVFPDVQEGNLDNLSRSIQEILKGIFTADSIQCQVEIEPTSSLAMELGGVAQALPQAEEKAEEAPREAEKIEESEFDRQIKEIEAEANYVVSGTSIVAPVKGKFINDVQIGEKIMVLLPGKDPVSRKILSVMNAVDADGKISPIKGRLKAIIPLEKSGNVLYALVAKGVLAKLIEEENVKIRLETSESDNNNKPADSRMIFVMAALVALIIIAGIILFILI